MGLGVLLAFELGVVEPELVGVIGFETGVGGLSAFKLNNVYEKTMRETF